jgi:hypothetical protein
MTFNLHFTVVGKDAEDILRLIYDKVQEFHGRLPSDQVFEHDMKVNVEANSFPQGDNRFTAEVTIPLNPFQRR